jgi:hypothetical protein
VCAYQKVDDETTRSAFARQLRAVQGLSDSAVYAVLNTYDRMMNGEITGHEARLSLRAPCGAATGDVLTLLDSFLEDPGADAALRAPPVCP